MLRLVLPKGSLERATLELFAAADLAVERSSEVDYRGKIYDPRVESVAILRPQEIPLYVAEGLFDLGVTGRDWIEETGADVVSLGTLRYSKATGRPIRIVLAVSSDSPVKGADELKTLYGSRPLRVATEYPVLARRYFESLGVEADITFSYGATEAKVPEIADAVVELTETGRALRAAGLRVVDDLLESHTELVANRASFDKAELRHAMRQLQVLLEGALEARENVLVKMNVAGPSLDAVIALLPSMRSPTVSQLFGENGYAIETVVPKRRVNTLIPALKDVGATDILELPLSKIVH